MVPTDRSAVTFPPPQHEPPAHLDHLAREVIGAAIEVHRHLGPGFREQVYEDALVIELEARKLRIQRQVAIPITYKDEQIAEARLDLLVENELIVEIKAVESLAAIHTIQVISYLRACSLDLALLLNFNVAFMKQGVRRVVCTR